MLTCDIVYVGLADVSVISIGEGISFPMLTYFVENNSPLDVAEEACIQAMNIGYRHVSTFY